MGIGIGNGVRWGRVTMTSTPAVNEAFEFTVKTDNAGASASDQFTIPITSATPYDISTSDGHSITGATGATTLTFSAPGTYTVKITESCEGWKFNLGGDRLKLLDISNWGVYANTALNSFYGASNMTCSAVDVPVGIHTTLQGAFQSCSNFNGAIGNWDVSGVTNMSGMFSGATSFNQDISAWDVSSVTNMAGMFNGATSFNRDLNTWNTSNVTSMAEMFRNNPGFNSNITTWDVSSVTSFQNMFLNQYSTGIFNQDISGWNVSSATNFLNMFYNTNFNQPIGSWTINTLSSVNMAQMFGRAASFNQPIGSWNTSLVTNMGSMFYKASSFDQDLDTWNTSSVTNMTSMFNGDGVDMAFNGDVSSWDTSSVPNMSYMFKQCRLFNQNISGWNTSSVTNMTQMFNAANVFNQPIGSWDVSSVTDMSNMFRSSAFNQDISSWNVSSVTNMAEMLLGTTAFDQNISNWDIDQVTSFTNFKRFGVPFSTANYDALLVSWEAQLQSSYPGGVGYTPVISINFGNSTYTLGSAAEAARTSLISTYGWTITDGGGIVARNTRIGGMASVYTTPASVASALGSGVTEPDITNFRISGSDVEFDVGVTYTLPDTFKNNTTITAFDDRQGNVIGLANQAFRYASSITYLNFPSLTVLPSFTFEGLTNLVSADFINCTDVGSGNNFLANNTATITVALSALTSDADGGPHQSLRTLNCTVDYDGYVDDGTWNTQIDGIASTENTRLLLGNRLGCKTAALLNFQIVGSDVRAKVYGNYSINGGAFQSRTDITDFKDNDNKVTNINSNAFAYTTNYLNATFNGITSLVANNQFRNSAIDTITMNGLTTISGNYLVRDTAVLEFIFPNLVNWNTNSLLYSNSSLNNIYAPKLETLGTTTGNDFAIAGNFANGGTITVSDVLQTCNGGLPDGDLDWLITNRSANVVYVSPFVGLLDTYSGAAAAYSLRDLAVASVGNPVVNVRRSSDNATQDFTSTEITDGTLLSFVGNTAADNGYVTTWYDQSGASNNLIQATQADQPKIVSSGVLVERNLKPAVEFDGTNVNFLEQSTALSLTEADGFIVVEAKNYPANATSGTESGLWGYSDAGSATHYSFNDGNIYDSFFTTQRKSTGTPQVTLAQLNLYNVLSKNAEWTSRLNSSQVFTTSSNTFRVSSPQYLGKNMEPGLPDYPLNGYVSEFIIYPSDQSTNRSGIESNINEHYSIYSEGYTDGLVASYNFDSDFTDYTGTHNATLGAATVTAGIGGGVVGNCADFDGVNGFLNVPNSTDFSMTDGATDTPYSISFWVKFDTTTTDQWFINRWGSTAQKEWIIALNVSGQLTFLLSDGNGANYIRTDHAWAPTLSTWYHLTFTYDGSTLDTGLKMYINGSITPSIPSTTGTYTGTSNTGFSTIIGENTLGSVQNLDGQMDEIHIWKNRELTAAEVTDIYNTENAGNSIFTDFTTNLVASYNFDSDFTDYTGTNNGTASGTPLAGQSGGVVGNCLTNNTSSYVSGGNDISLQATTVSFSAWVKAPANQGGVVKGIISKARAWGLYILTNGNLATYQWPSTGFIDSGVSIADNQWHHVCMTMQSGIANGSKIYIDGNLVSTFTYSISQQIIDLRIGGGENATQSIDAQIDEAHVWTNRVLTPTEVTDIYNTENAGNSILP